MEFRETASRSQDQPHLGASINIATRALHAKLNRQILRYFPLALPPHASDPSVYLAGLLQVAPLYFTFECLWEDILAAHEKHTSTITTAEDKYCSFPSPGLTTPPSSPSSLLNTTTPRSPQIPPDHNNNNKRAQALLGSLRRLYDPLLARTKPLLSDLRALTSVCCPPSDDSNNPPTETPTPQTNLSLLRSESEPPPPVLGTLLTHMQQAVTIGGVTPRPHLVLAYAWVLYMALFAGGRVLRGVLEGAGVEFWEGRLQELQSVRHMQTPVQTTTSLQFRINRGADKGTRVGEKAEEEAVDEEKEGEEEEDAMQKMPLAFFRFNTPRGGEDLKGEFKRRFQEAGEVLTAGERDEVIKEAESIFEHLIALVAWLHETLDRDRADASWAGWVSRWVGWPAARIGWTGRARGDLQPANKRDSGAKKVHGEKVVRFEEVGPGREGEHDTRSLGSGLGAWELVLGLLIVGISLGLAYAWR